MSLQKFLELEGRIVTLERDNQSLREDNTALSKVVVELREEMRALKLAMQLAKGGKKL
jgi:uncharacterized protein YaaN involved in tellurite resistance